MALLCLVSSVLMLGSCADSDKDNKNNGEVKNDIEHLEGLDFEGLDVKFIISEATTAADEFNSRSIYVDEDNTDDAVNSAIFDRNARVQELLNINIVVVDSAHTGIKSWIGSQLLAGVTDYDIISARQFDDVQLALDGVILDLNTLDKYGADYIKWNEEYWATSYIDALSFGDKTFWLTGDLCLRYSGGFYAFFVNSRLYQDMLQSEYGGMYQLVNDGKWTYDMLIEMISKCYKDDGDDIVDIEDQFGMLFPVWDSTNGMAISAGVKFTSYDEAGVPHNNMNASNEVLISYMNKCHELFSTKGCYSFNAPSADYEKAMQLFAAGQSMFVVGRVNFAELYLRDMTDDYYIIPCPKLDESQTQYYSSVHDAMSIYGINFNIDDTHIQAAAATLEAMAYYSYKDVRPIYFDSFLKFKFTRDDEAWKMIDLMHDSIYTDFVHIWMTSADMNKLNAFLRNNVIRNNPTSDIKKYVGTWNNGLEKILTRIEELES